MTNKGKMIEDIYGACLTKRATLVIFYLINRANQELTCFPSVGTIARECNISTRTVQRALNDLEESGFLERESRFHERGGQRSNIYYIKSVAFDPNKIEKIDFPEVYSAALSIKKKVVKETFMQKESELLETRPNCTLKKVLNSLKFSLLRMLSWRL